VAAAAAVRPLVAAAAAAAALSAAGPGWSIEEPLTSKLAPQQLQVAVALQHDTTKALFHLIDDDVKLKMINTGTS